MQSDELKNLILEALDDLKGQQIVELDVRELTDVADYLIIASGTSNRHVRSLADNARDAAKQAGVKPLGVEGLNGCEWVLVDFADVVVHVMLPATRDFYDLERLWSDTATPAASVEPVEPVE
jgi:ribosome-associated protein